MIDLSFVDEIHKKQVRIQSHHMKSYLTYPLEPRGIVNYRLPICTQFLVQDGDFQLMTSKSTPFGDLLHGEVVLLSQ
jgi:hypothetical protein